MNGYKPYEKCRHLLIQLTHSSLNTILFNLFSMFTHNFSPDTFLLQLLYHQILLNLCKYATGDHSTLKKIELSVVYF